jgi:hypothetical protein
MGFPVYRGIGKLKKDYFKYYLILLGENLTLGLPLTTSSEANYQVLFLLFLPNPYFYMVNFW